MSRRSAEPRRPPHCTSIVSSNGSPAPVPHELLAVGDLDGDGRPEIVAAGAAASELLVLRGL